MSNIQKTQDYRLFKTIISNREVDKRHVNRLVSAIQANNLLHVNPIIVNARMEVIDGQHRLEAAEKLGTDIYYTIDDNISKSDIASLNSNQKNWTLMDYINYYTINGNPDFVVLSNFINNNQDVPPSCCLQLLSDDNSRNTNALKTGKIDISNLAQAEKIAGWLHDFKEYEFWNNRDFILSLRKVDDTGNYDHEVMKHKLTLQPRSFVKCVNVKQYIEMFEEIYNHKTHTKVRFF